MDSARATRVLARIPSSVVAVHLSGVKDEASLCEIAAGRADAALIGEALMRADDPRPLLSRFVAAAVGAGGAVGNSPRT
jgi:indole-3-glycerol phosphate synthase